MTAQDAALAGFEAFAWIGEDELGSGVVGLKMMRVPSGVTALVSIKKDQMAESRFTESLQAQATEYGKTIHLVRLAYVETIITLEP